MKDDRLYLYHMPVLNLLIFLGWFSAQASLAALFAVTATLAIGSWFIVEKPALRLKR